MEDLGLTGMGGLLPLLRPEGRETLIFWEFGMAWYGREGV